MKDINIIILIIFSFIIYNYIFENFETNKTIKCDVGYFSKTICEKIYENVNLVRVFQLEKFQKFINNYNIGTFKTEVSIKSIKIPFNYTVILNDTLKYGPCEISSLPL